MGNCISQCISGEDDQCHRSPSQPSGHLSHAHSTTQKGDTTTSAGVSDGPEPAGPCSLTSAEVETILSTAAATQESSEPCISVHLTSAEVGVCPGPQGPSTTSGLSSAEDETILSKAAATQESSGHLTSAEVGGCPEPPGPFIPSSLASAEVGTVLSTAAATQDPSGPCSSGTTKNPSCGTDVLPAATDMMATGSDTANHHRFTLHCVLGAGSYGKVVLATHRKSQQKVAIKTVIKYRHRHHIEIERYVLEMAAGCPFLTQLYATFQTRCTACFVMEYASGGTLHEFLRDESPLDREDIKFIVAEISCGLEFLHRHGVLHRDIKLDNILMDGNGHVRIADFGLAITDLIGDTLITGDFGTIGYIAPEVVNNDFYQFEPDWFALGVVTYMLATESRPFRCRTYDEYRREVNFYYPDYPPDMDPDLKDFIRGLLCKYPEERLGVRDNIRSHPFLDTINWEELEEGRTPPPFPVEPPVDVEIPSRLSPSVIQRHPRLSGRPEEEVYLPDFTHVCSAWARM